MLLLIGPALFTPQVFLFSIIIYFYQYALHDKAFVKPGAVAGAWFVWEVSMHVCVCICVLPMKTFTCLNNQSNKSYFLYIDRRGLSNKVHQVALEQKPL